MFFKTTLQNYLWKRWLLLLILLISLNKSYAQNGVAINTTGASADNSAILDLSNSVGKGLLLPQFSSLLAVTNVHEGLVVYIINTGIYYRTSSSWILLSTSTGTVTSVTATGPLSSSGGVTPNITISQANGTTSGYLSSTDWNIFNSKGSGSVTSVSVAAANGISGVVATPTTTPAITLTLGNITPTSVAASGTVTGSNLSGTNTGNVTIAGQNYLTLSGQQITANAINLTSQVTGTLPVANGGTGTTTTTQYGVVYGASTTAYGTTTAGTTGQVLTATTSGAPNWKDANTLTLGQNVSTVYGTSSINTTSGFVLIPGLTTSINVTANSNVLITTYGGTSTRSTAFSQTEIAILIDGTTFLTDAQDVISPYGDYFDQTPLIGNWSFTTTTTLSTGTHTIAVYAVRNGGTTSGATVSGNSTSVLQGGLTVAVIKQ